MTKKMPKSKKEKTFSEKLKLIEASVLLADFWGVEPVNLLGFQALIQPEKMKAWNKIAKECVEFYEMPIEKRAKKMGFKLTNPNTGEK